MHGPEILARFLQAPTPKPDKFGIRWQYNSQSDRHSKVGCWGIAFDLLNTSSLLRRHVSDGKVVMGVNHKMIDFSTHRDKRLDLVIARPDGSPPATAKTFADLVKQYKMVLTGEEQAILAQFPVFPIADVGSVLVALEAKATMTEHVGALPRLYDELNSSHLATHGNSPQALAIGYVQINAAVEFFSSVLNRGKAPADFIPNVHDQPYATNRVLEKVEQLPRRSHSSEVGFDGLGVTILDFRNDGTSPVSLVTAPPAPRPGSPFHYDTMIRRMANEYDTRFAAI